VTSINIVIGMEEMMNGYRPSWFSINIVIGMEDDE
jgi:hypothetical protein